MFIKQQIDKNLTFKKKVGFWSREGKERKERKECDCLENMEEVREKLEKIMGVFREEVEGLKGEMERRIEGLRREYEEEIEKRRGAVEELTFMTIRLMGVKKELEKEFEWMLCEKNREIKRLKLVILQSQPRFESGHIDKRLNQKKSLLVPINILRFGSSKSMKCNDNPDLSPPNPTKMDKLYSISSSGQLIRDSSHTPPHQKIPILSRNASPKGSYKSINL